MREQDNQYFKNALSDFAYDVAFGAQIRHLADLGYTINQILPQLDLAIPYRKVQETITNYLRETGILISDKPGSAVFTKSEFVREYDSYGRSSFRRITTEKKAGPILWQEQLISPVSGKELREFLNRKTKENGEDVSYISCDFGVDKQKFTEILNVLESRQQEYMEGILWEKSRMYHRLTPRMQEIAARLYERGLYEGEGYFQKTKEHIIFTSVVNY